MYVTFIYTSRYFYYTARLAVDHNIAKKAVFIRPTVVPNNFLLQLYVRSLKGFVSQVEDRCDYIPGLPCIFFADDY